MPPGSSVRRRRGRPRRPASGPVGPTRRRGRRDSRARTVPTGTGAARPARRPRRSLLRRLPRRLGRQTYDDSRLLVMAIINRTPDSFYDKGATYDDAAALAAVDRAVDEGADIVDVGGVKAGPGEVVDATEEVRRVAPFVALVRAAHPDLVISVDTWRAEVGRACLAEGTDVINDAWGGVDPALAEEAAAAGAALVCTHAGHVEPRTRPHRIAYDDVVNDV